MGSNSVRRLGDSVFLGLGSGDDDCRINYGSGQNDYYSRLIFVYDHVDSWNSAHSFAASCRLRLYAAPCGPDIHSIVFYHRLNARGPHRRPGCVCIGRIRASCPALRFLWGPKSGRAHCEPLPSPLNRRASARNPFGSVSWLKSALNGNKCWNNNNKLINFRVLDMLMYESGNKLITNDVNLI